jgi:hypothetical protein
MALEELQTFCIPQAKEKQTGFLGFDLNQKRQWCR